ncbi:MAG: hypothetical protein K2N14_01010 [Clostridia bacterium]|nr:hypothetical protein [Clostridia bacterium]
MEKEQMAKQQALYDALLYYGLLKDLKIVEDEMCKNEPLPTDKSNGALRNFWNKNVLNETRRRTMTKLSEKKNNILNRLEEFKSKREQSGIDYSAGEDREKLSKQIDEVFSGDNANLSKALFALQFCLDNQIEYENKETVYAEISYYLFSDKNVISNLYSNLKENYIQLFRAPFDKVQKTILKCLGISAIIAIALPSVVTGGAVATALVAPALLEGVLAEIGIGIAATVEVAAVYSSILLGGALIGTEIAKQIKINNAKESLRKTSPEDLSLLLAIKATLIQYAKNSMGEEEMKSALDDCLKQLNDLRADAEYLLIVERLDAEKSKKKIDICNNFTSRLVNIVGL